MEKAEFSDNRPANRMPIPSALVDDALHGDRAAVEKLMMLTYDPVFRYARRCLGRGETVGDLVQDVMIKAFSRLSDLQDPKSYGAWVMGITRNEIRKHRRDGGRRATYFQAEAGDEEIEGVADSALDPLATLIAADRRAMVSEVLESLKPADREILELYAYRNLTVAEIAHVLHVSGATASKRLKRACGRFKEIAKHEVGLYEEA